MTCIFSQLFGKSNSKLGERRYHFLVLGLLGGVKLKDPKFIYSTTDVNRVIKRDMFIIEEMGVLIKKKKRIR